MRRGDLPVGHSRSYEKRALLLKATERPAGEVSLSTHAGAGKSVIHHPENLPVRPMASESMVPQSLGFMFGFIRSPRIASCRCE